MVKLENTSEDLEIYYVEIFQTGEIYNESNQYGKVFSLIPNLNVYNRTHTKDKSCEFWICDSLH